MQKPTQYLRTLKTKKQSDKKSKLSIALGNQQCIKKSIKQIQKESTRKQASIGSQQNVLEMSK